MSLLLEALKRAQRERSREPLAQRVAGSEPPRPSPRGGRWLLWAVPLLLAINAALLGWLLLGPRPSAPPVHSPAPPPPPRSAHPASAPPPATAATPAPVPAAATRPEAAPSPGPARRVLHSLADARPPAPPRPATPRRASPAPPPAAEAAAPKNQPTATATDKTGPAGPAPRPLAALPPDMRAQVERLQVAVHFYSPQAARRFVIIAGRKYHEGDTIAGTGLRLETIAPHGLLLSRHGVRTELPLGGD